MAVRRGDGASRRSRPGAEESSGPAAGSPCTAPGGCRRAQPIRSHSSGLVLSLPEASVNKKTKKKPKPPNPRKPQTSAPRTALTPSNHQHAGANVASLKQREPHGDAQLGLCVLNVNGGCLKGLVRMSFETGGMPSAWQHLMSH